jgi:NAD(P)-dependent dehydrogenase (short-subunit alcohol dehydrogenase family)
MNRPLAGRAAVITGASQGLGLAISAAYVDAGASVLMCARDEAVLQRAHAEISARAASDQQVVGRVADVSRAADVEGLAAAAFDLFPQVHVLVNNAGIYGPKGPTEDVDWDAWVQAIQVNLYGSVLPCRALVPHFKARGYGKIIQLSGGGATNPLPRLSAYAASKAAVVRFAETLAEELRGSGIDVNAIAPGALNTRLLDEVLEAGPAVVGDAFYARAIKQRDEGGAPLVKGAGLAVFLASAGSDGITGKLLSALWDPWATLPEHLDDLTRTDVYTLRRIVPSDRGFEWNTP